MKGSFVNSSINGFPKGKRNSDQDSDIDNDYSDSNIEQQSKQFYDKVEQTNQMGKSILNNSLGPLKQQGDQFKNGLDKSIKDQQDINSSMKQTIKGAGEIKQSFQNPYNNIPDYGNGIKQTIKGVDGINLGQQNISGLQNSMKSTIKQVDNYQNNMSVGMNNVISVQQNIDLGGSMKQTVKGLSIQGQKNINEKMDENFKNGINKSGLSDFGASQYINDQYKNADQHVNNSINDTAKQMGSINPFMQKHDSNQISVLGASIERNQNGINSVVNQRQNNSYISKGLEGEISTDYNNNDISLKNPFQSQMNKLRPNPVHTNQSDMVLAAKQSKGVFQQSIIHNNLQQANNVNPNTSIQSVIQVYDEKQEKKEKGGIVKSVPWILLGIIGLWTFVFMVSDIIDFKNWKFIEENSLTNIAGWYSTNQSIQKAALSYSGGMGRNYISLIDFILFFFITKVFYNLWLTNDYIQVGPLKNNLMAFLFLKDIAIIILSLSSGDYASPSGWDGFGYFWLKTFGKISIVISFSKLFFFRLNYFKTFVENKDGCSGILSNWGIQLYNWASQNNRNPEFILSLLIFGLYFPLVLHCIVGVIESTYILIIWIAILFFLQQVLQFLFEICRPRQDDKTLTQRLMERQKSGITDQINKFWVYFTLLYVIIPGVASVSFGNNFKDSIKFHFSGQQLMFSFFSFPPSGSSYSSTMTLICNILSLI